MNYKHILAKSALFAAAFIWGMAFFIMKNTVEIFQPFVLLAIRFTAACIILAVLFCKRLKNLDFSYLWQGALMGVCLFLGYALQTLGITGTTPGKNAFLTSAYCILVPFLSWFINRIRPDVYSFSAAFLCVAGIGCVSLTNSFSIGFGDGLTLVSALFYALHIIVVSRYTKDRDPILFTIIQFGIAAVLAFSFGVIFNEFPPLETITKQAVLSLCFLSVFATAGAILFQNIGMKYSSAAASSVILSLESVFGVMFSVIFYGEMMTSRLYAGFALIFISVILSETKLSFLKLGGKPVDIR